MLVGRTDAVLLTAKDDLQKSHHGTDIRTYVLDITDNSAVNRIFKRVRDEVGPIDILVSNAGYLPDHALIAEAEVAEWWSGFVSL